MSVESAGGRSNVAAFALLGLASALCVALVLVRTAYSHTTNFQFLLWNLFLAWIPLALAALALAVLAREAARSAGDVTSAALAARRTLPFSVFRPLMVLAFIQCGYSLRGTGSFLPPSIKKISIPLFKNLTTRFQ